MILTKSIFDSNASMCICRLYENIECEMPVYTEYNKISDVLITERRECLRFLEGSLSAADGNFL